jgi:hypothetical protein
MQYFLHNTNNLKIKGEESDFISPDHVAAGFPAYAPYNPKNDKHSDSTDNNEQDKTPVKVLIQGKGE